MEIKSRYSSIETIYSRAGILWSVWREGEEEGERREKEDKSRESRRSLSVFGVAKQSRPLHRALGLFFTSRLDTYHKPTKIYGRKHWVALTPPDKFICDRVIHFRRLTRLHARHPNPVLTRSTQPIFFHGPAIISDLDRLGSYSK